MATWDKRYAQDAGKTFSEQQGRTDSRTRLLLADTKNTHRVTQRFSSQVGVDTVNAGHSRNKIIEQKMSKTSYTVK